MEKIKSIPKTAKQIKTAESKNPYVEIESSFKNIEIIHGRKCVCYYHISVADYRLPKIKINRIAAYYLN